MLTPAYDIRTATGDFDTMLEMAAIWRRAGEILLDGDYYSLTPPGRTDDQWVAWQFDRPKDLANRGAADGFVQAIRLPHCEEPAITVPIRGLRRDASYVLEEAETGERREASGAALLDDGFEFTLPRRSGSLWFYHEQNG